ncbi:MAG: hypothetical protein ABIH11_07350 [Candidatus Altiarchaeota archaeon]
MRSKIVDDGVNPGLEKHNTYLENIIDAIPGFYLIGVLMWPTIFKMHADTVKAFLMLEVAYIFIILGVVALSDEFRGSKRRREGRYHDLMVGLLIFSAPYILILYLAGQAARQPLLVAYFLAFIISTLRRMLGKEKKDHYIVLTNWTISFFCISISLFVGVFLKLLVAGDSLIWDTDCVKGLCVNSDLRFFAAWMGSYYLIMILGRILLWDKIMDHVKQTINQIKKRKNKT